MKIERTYHDMSVPYTNKNLGTYEFYIFCKHHT